MTAAVILALLIPAPSRAQLNGGQASGGMAVISDSSNDQRRLNTVVPEQKALAKNEITAVAFPGAGLNQSAAVRVAQSVPLRGGAQIGQLPSSDVAQPLLTQSIRQNLAFSLPRNAPVSVQRSPTFSPSYRTAPEAADRWLGGDFRDLDGDSSDPSPQAPPGRREAMRHAREMARSFVSASAEALKEAAGIAKAGDKAEPNASERALLLAAMGPYRDTLAKSGLRVGRDDAGAARIERADGRPADRTDLKSFADRIAGEPKALERRPDFFAVVPREAYAAVKSEAATRSVRAELKDVGLSPRGRDLIWARSCEKVAGDCNRMAAESYYTRGRFVSPETLRSVWQKMQEGVGPQVLGKAPAPALDKLAAGKLARRVLSQDILSRFVDRVRQALGGWLGDGNSPAARAASIPEAADEVPVSIADARVSDALGSVPQPLAAASRSAQTGLKHDLPSPLVPSPSPGARPPWFWIVLFIVGSLLLLRGLRPAVGRKEAN